MASKFLVTGGAGYVGSHVVADLVARGHDVVVLDNLQQGHREAVPPEATLVVGDLADRDAVRRLLRSHSFEAVLHFAANSLVGESMRRPFRYIGDNVTNALVLLEACVETGVRKFVLSSTCAVYGEPERLPITESIKIDPANPYGESKYLIERALRWADQIHGLRSACLRYFNAAGAHPLGQIGEDHQPETHLIPIALEVALGNRPFIEIFGNDYATPDGTCVRDYIHVCDLADAHVRALEMLNGRSVTYNVGIGRGYSVREVLGAVRRVTRAKIPEKIGPRRQGDPPILVAASQMIRSDLGWIPRYTELDQIVATAWNWRRNHPQGFATSDQASRSAGRHALSG